MRLNPFMADALVQLIEGVSSGLDDTLPGRAEIPQSDEYLAAAWKRDLKDDQDHDVEILMKLLRDRRFGREKIEVDDATAEAILRAASALRLQIQDQLLQSIPESKLETGEVDLGYLPVNVQRGYACYHFLASLQSLIVMEMDPEAGKM